MSASDPKAEENEQDFIPEPDSAGARRIAVSAQEYAHDKKMYVRVGPRLLTTQEALELARSIELSGNNYRDELGAWRVERVFRGASGELVSMMPLSEGLCYEWASQLANWLVDDVMITLSLIEDAKMARTLSVTPSSDDDAEVNSTVVADGDEEMWRTQLDLLGD